ncbi:MAG: hypothetical protein IAF38_02055, partial [Bacteroidia bacterium]|nr:hypothetical protein [Bacteroidia bacterium]
MKKYLLTLASGLLVMSSFAQIKLSEGPGLNNDEDNKMNRMIEGEDGAFYSYRIRTRGKGTSYIIEKFDRTKLTTLFSKEVEIPTDRTKVLDVEFAGGKVFVIYRTYDKDKEIMSVYFKTVSPLGQVSGAATELFNRKTDHYEFIDFDISTNQSKSKFAVRTTYKANKEDTYKTDFILYDASAQKTIWTKTVNKYLKKSNPWFVWSFRSTETTGLLGFMLNDNDDIYYAFNEKLKKDDKKDDRYNATVEILKADSKSPIATKLDLNAEYVIYDASFCMSNNTIMLAGFFKDVIERKGRDLVDVGVFNYKLNNTTGAIEGKAVKTFDAKILTAIESSPKKARGMNYKVDYILASGDAFYLVGEQYIVTVQDRNQGMLGDIVGLASGANPFYIGKNFIYEYMDVIVAKINGKGEFEWVSNSPLRNGTTTIDNPHVFKQYIAYVSSKGLYLFYNEHRKNEERLLKPDYEPRDLKTQVTIHGSNFVYSKITPDGKVKHAKICENETYCFAPIQERDLHFLPPEDAEIYVNGKPDEIIIYQEDHG